MNAEIEAFCEKHILPRKTREDLLLLVEEMLQIYAPYLSTAVLDLTISYSERNERLELVWESTGESVNPLDSDRLPDELGLSIIRNLTDSIEYVRMDDRNRLSLRLRPK